MSGTLATATSQTYSKVLRVKVQPEGAESDLKVSYSQAYLRPDRATVTWTWDGTGRYYATSVTITGGLVKKDGTVSALERKAYFYDSTLGDVPEWLKEHLTEGEPLGFRGF